MVRFQVKYRTFDEIEDEKKWWRVPFVSEFFRKNGFQSALKRVGGSETVQAREFVEYAFGQLKSFNDTYLGKDRLSNSRNDTEGSGKSNNPTLVTDMPTQMEGSGTDPLNNTTASSRNSLEYFNTNYDEVLNGDTPEPVTQVGEGLQSHEHFWKNLASIVNKNVVQKLDIPIPGKLRWDGYELLNRIGSQSRKMAEASFVESGLATPEGMDGDQDKANESLSIDTIQSSLPDIKKATEDLLRQTDSVLGALMVLTAAISKSNKNTSDVKDGLQNYSMMEELSSSKNGSVLDESKVKEMKAFFSTAETAMEAWSMLATSLGHPSFIKSEFEKICFLDNESTDTQVIFPLSGDLVLFL